MNTHASRGTGIAVVAWLALTLAAAAADTQLAFIAMERVFDEYHKTKAANAQLKARAEEVDAQRKTLVTDVKALKAELETLQAEVRDKSLSDAERDKKRRAGEEKYTQFRDAEDKLLDFDKEQKKEFGDKMRQTQQQLLVEIRAVIQKLADERGIAAVLDSSGKTLNNVEAAVFVNARLDITDEVLSRLNKNAPATTAAPVSGKASDKTADLK